MANVSKEGNKKPRKNKIQETSFMEEDPKKVNNELEDAALNVYNKQEQQKKLNNIVLEQLERDKKISDIKDNLENNIKKQQEEKKERIEKEERIKEFIKEQNEKEEKKLDVKSWLIFYIPIILLVLGISSVFITFYFLGRLQVNY